MSLEESNVDRIKELYRLYAAGEIDPVIDALHEDVRWCSAGSADQLPWLGQCYGRDGVIRYFETLRQNLSVERYEPKYFVAQGDRVVSVVELTVRDLNSGRGGALEKADVFRLRDGKILEFDEFYDTAGVAALRA